MTLLSDIDAWRESLARKFIGGKIIAIKDNYNAGLGIIIIVECPDGVERNIELYTASGYGGIMMNNDIYAS